MTLVSACSIFAIAFRLTTKVGETMILIKVKENESIDRALRRYKKKFEKTGILREVRGRMYFLKPSVVKREQMKKARRRQEHYAEENY